MVWTHVPFASSPVPNTVCACVSLIVCLFCTLQEAWQPFAAVGVGTSCRVAFQRFMDVPLPPELHVTPALATIPPSLTPLAVFINCYDMHGLLSGGGVAANRGCL